MKFKAPLDNLVLIISAACFLLFIAISYFVFTNEQLTLVAVIAITSSLWLTFIFCYLYHPTAYSVSRDVITIHRPLSSVIISRSDILEIRIPTQAEMRWSIRTFGVGGLFGYFGKFTNTQLGNMTWYATQRSNYVLLITNTNRIILTPDNPKNFLAALL
ncbi:MAG: PH domain-containing protein [Chitinophagales bacterium]